jgi:hypothetical protein
VTDTKWCPHCQAWKPLSDFYPSRSTASGLDGYCKEYRREAQRERQRAHRIARQEALADEGRTSTKTPWRVDDAGRECSSCGQYKVWNEFHASATATTGHQTKCKQCVRARQRELASTEAGREAARARQAAYQERKRGPNWKPAQVSRHAQLDCDGVQHICTGCGTRKSVSSFPRNADTPCGFDPRCTKCRHERREQRRAVNWNSIRDKENLHWAISRFGITADEYLSLLARQGGGCALCGLPEDASGTGLRKKKRLSVDHDHEHCGMSRACKECIRGLLCHGCNVGLGMFEAKERTRHRFADYLERRPFRE